MKALEKLKNLICSEVLCEKRVQEIIDELKNEICEGFEKEYINFRADIIKKFELALSNQLQPIWCKHIRRFIDGDHFNSGDPRYYGTTKVTPIWKVCPVCLIERPKEF